MAAKEKPRKAKPAKEAPPQKELIKLPEGAPVPSVQGARMRVQYVKPLFDRTKSGDRTISLALSFPLVKEHNGLLPKKVKTGWEFMLKKGYKRLDVVDVPGQHATFFLTHDDPEAAVTLPAARVTHASLQAIEEKGSGEAKDVIRFSFRLKVPMSHEVARFSEWNYGDLLWIEMDETQEALFDEDGDEAE